MLKKHYSEVAEEDVVAEGAKNVKIQWLINKDVAGAHFAMRRFTILPGGHTGYHKHDWEHEIYVLEGEGVLKFEDKEYPLKPGTFAFVDGGKNHQFLNAGITNFVFLCFIPL
ncbi:MAG: cupin domain-containing protein [Thermoplasmata archaeon]